MPKSKRSSSKRVGALLLIDVINGFDFPGSQAIVRAATKAAPAIEALAERARQKKVPVIYVNDNFGRWRSDFEAIIEACTAPDQPGREVADRLRPEPGDYFVLKPRHQEHPRADAGAVCAYPSVQVLRSRKVIVLGVCVALLIAARAALPILLLRFVNDKLDELKGYSGLGSFVRVRGTRFRACGAVRREGLNR